MHPWTLSSLSPPYPRDATTIINTYNPIVRVIGIGSSGFSVIGTISFDNHPKGEISHHCSHLDVMSFISGTPNQPTFGCYILYYWHPQPTNLSSPSRHYTTINQHWQSFGSSIGGVGTTPTCAQSICKCHCGESDHSLNPNS